MHPWWLIGGADILYATALTLFYGVWGTIRNPSPEQGAGMVWTLIVIFVVSNLAALCFCLGLFFILYGLGVI